MVAESLLMTVFERLELPERFPQKYFVQHVPLSQLFVPACVAVLPSWA